VGDLLLRRAWTWISGLNVSSYLEIILMFNIRNLLVSFSESITIFVVILSVSVQRVVVLGYA
jgi:hypothetical protein